MPAGFEIRPLESWVGEEHFNVEVANPTSARLSFSLVGGLASSAAQPPDAHQRAEIPVRGQPDYAYTTGAGYSLFWAENGQPFALISELNFDTALAIVEAWEPVDRAWWPERHAVQ